MRWLIVLFVVVPLAELYLLLLVGSLIGFWPTVGLTLVTGIVGGALAKHEGLRVWRAWRRSLSELKPPETGVIDGVLVLLGGASVVQASHSRRDETIAHYHQTIALRPRWEVPRQNLERLEGAPQP